MTQIGMPCIMTNYLLLGQSYFFCAIKTTTSLSQVSVFKMKTNNPGIDKFPAPMATRSNPNIPNSHESLVVNALLISSQTRQSQHLEPRMTAAQRKRALIDVIDQALKILDDTPFLL